MVSTGKNKHIYSNDTKKAFNKDQFSPLNKKLRKAQNILNSSSSEQSLLAKKMLADMLKARLENKDELELVANSVCEWSWSENSANLRSGADMQLSDWQQELLDNIRHLHPEKIYIFSKADVNCFWIITQSPTSKTVKTYFRIYVDTLEKYPNVLCDFLVYGPGEVHEETLPENFRIIGCI